MSTENRGEICEPSELIVPTDTTAQMVSGALVVSGGYLMFIHGTNSYNISISGAAISV